jgi:hypothetical protein
MELVVMKYSDWVGREWGSVGVNKLMSRELSLYIWLAASPDSDCVAHTPVRMDYIGSAKSEWNVGVRSGSLNVRNDWRRRSAILSKRVPPWKGWLCVTVVSKGATRKTV